LEPRSKGTNLSPLSCHLQGWWLIYITKGIYAFFISILCSAPSYPLSSRAPLGGIDPATHSHVLLPPSLARGAARQSLGIAGGGSSLPVRARVGMVPGQTHRRCCSLRGGSRGYCGVRDGVPPSLVGERWILGRRPWTWWWRCTSLVGLVASHDHVVKLFAGGGGKGGVGLSGMDIGLTQSSASGETLDPQISRWWRWASFPPWRHRLGASLWPSILDP
jgi:hypothetical protein